jgi:hypothetical protein
MLFVVVRKMFKYSEDFAITGKKENRTKSLLVTEDNPY